MRLSDEFSDPRLVAAYESLNAYEPETQPRFYRELAQELRARRILDVGCGTGLISRGLARLGYDVIGLDPASLMIEAACAKPFGDRVRWVVGPAWCLGPANLDLAIMTGHVAQFFLDDSEWQRALQAIHACLRSGGHLAFETRNPVLGQWQGWRGADQITVHHRMAGYIQAESVAGPIEHGLATSRTRYTFLAMGEERTSETTLRFRTEAELLASLTAAGFTIQRLHGDWDHSPVARSSPELIVVAHRA